MDPARAAALAAGWNPHLPTQPEPPGGQNSPGKPKKPSKVARQLAAMSAATPSPAGQPEGQQQRMKRITNTDDVYTIHKGRYLYDVCTGRRGGG